MYDPMNLYFVFSFYFLHSKTTTTNIYRYFTIKNKAILQKKKKLLKTEKRDVVGMIWNLLKTFFMFHYLFLFFTYSKM